MESGEYSATSSPADAAASMATPRTCDPKAGRHLLGLMFFGTAESNHRGFDGKWRVFGDFESRGRGGQHGDSAHLRSEGGSPFAGPDVFRHGRIQPPRI